MRLTLYASLLWHIFFFFFIHKLIELPGLLESWWTYKGLIYYKDFATFHFPLGRWILIPFYVATNWSLQIGPLLGLVTNLILVIIIYKYGQKYFTKAATVVSIIFFSLFSWYLGTAILFYHEMLIGLLLLISFYYFSSHKSGFKLGILASLTTLVGQIIAPTIAVFSILVAFRNPKKIWGYLLGLILPLGVLSVYFYTHNAFGNFFEQNFLYYTTYAHTYEKVPFLSLPIVDLFLFYFPLLLSLIHIIYLKINNKKIDFLQFASSVLLLSTIPFILFSVFHFHHISIALPIASIVLGFVYSKSNFNKTILLFIVLLSIKLLPWYINTVSLKNVGRIANNLTVGDSMHQTSEWIINNTPAEATILVAGDALFYFSADRLPSNKNAYVSPYNWEPLDETINDVDQNLPDYWIINRTYFTRLIKEYKKQSMVDYIENTLKLKYSQEAVMDDWEIWKKVN